MVAPAQDQAAISPPTAGLAVEPAGPLYVNQAFKLSLTIDSGSHTLHPAMDLGALSPSPALETLGGFSEERTPSASTRRFVCEARVTEPGKVTIHPSLQARSQVRERGLLGYHWVSRPIAVAVTPLKLNILAIPEKNRPRSFSGIVGACSLDVEVHPTTVAVGDLVTATLTIQSQAPLDNIIPPRLSPGHDFKVYDPTLKDGSTSTRMVIEQVLIPQRTNAVAIPPVTFSYFDPLKAAFQTITRGPFPLAYREHADNGVEPFRPDAATNTTSTGTAPARSTVRQPDGGWRDALRELFRTVPRATVREETRARIAPAWSALELFTVPTGSITDVHQLSGEWALVALGNKRGWIPASLLTVEK
jgi:hypothetical protein